MTEYNQSSQIYFTKKKKKNTFKLKRHCVFPGIEKRECSVGKNPSANAGHSITGLARYPGEGNGNPLQHGQSLVGYSP